MSHKLHDASPLGKAGSQMPCFPLCTLNFTLREWYHSGAILLSSTFSQQVISALYDLGEVDFDLSFEGADLDETWPSFVL